MLHHMHLHLSTFTRIRNGKKSIEVRLLDEKRQQMAVGDIVEFTNRDNNTETFTKTITQLITAPSFKTLLEKISLPAADFASLEAGLEELSIYYSEEEEEKLGTIAIILG